MLFFLELRFRLRKDFIFCRLRYYDHAVAVAKNNVSGMDVYIYVDAVQHAA